MQLFLNVLVFNVGLQRGKKVKNEGEEGLLNPLEVISARREGDCNRVGRHSGCSPLIRSSYWQSQQGPLVFGALYAHPSSHRL